MDSYRPLPPSPVSPPVDPNRVLVVVTLDAERYTPVDLADILDHGAVIRARILNKLSVWGAEERSRALIFETEIGSLQIGQPLTDRSLSALCRERGDSKGSLALIVDCGPSARQSRPQSPHPPTNPSNNFTTRGSPLSPLPTINDQTPLTRPPLSLRSPIDRPIDISSENNNVGGVSEPQPRRVRPLPAIPTPASTPSSGTPYASSHDVKNENNDFYDSALRIDTSGASLQAQGQESSRATKRSLRQLTIPSDHSQTTPSAGSSGSSSTPIPFNWVRGKLIGGNGVDSRVYMALNPESGQIMALKQKEIPFFPPHSTRRPLADYAKRSFLEAVKFESELLQALDHKNIVKHFFLEETDTTVNILMEYVPGGTLRGIIKSFGPFPDKVTKFLTAQILDGLAYLHSNYIVHRDLRAENILVQQDGVCKISDFSVSKFADGGGRVFTALQGSTFWMAPEVITTKIHGGGYTSKVDIWSLGCLVLEMWSSGRPWTGLDASKVMKRLSDALPPPLPDGLKLSQKARDFYDKCFIVDPASRPSASDLRTHRYLNLPDDWIFSLPASRTSGGPSRDTSQLATPTTPVVVVDKASQRFGLHGFPRYSSSGLSPSEWLQKNTLDLMQYISQSEYDFKMREEYSSWVKSCLLFPRLIMFSCEAIYDLTELRTAIHSWKSWDTQLTALIHYQEVNDRLLSFYGDMDQVHGLRTIVALDVDAICVNFHSIVTNEELFQRMLDLRGSEAQSILDLLQTLLDISTLAVEFKRHFMVAMLRLSRRSGLHPSLLSQRQVILEGAYPIASGHFGDVWKGSFRNQQVAVKVLKFYASFELERHLKNVLRETLIWRQLRHSNVLPFFCLHHVQDDERRIGLVSPWMDNGNLQQFLWRTSDANRVSLMTDIAEGLEYLHNNQPAIIHGDLKAVNVLITDTRRACLADFGLSTASKSQVFNMSSSSDRAGGTSRWTAPELLNGSQSTNTPKSDVYSFGCICYEIFSGDIPFSEASLDSAVIYKVTVQRQRPCRPENCKPHGKSPSSLGLNDHLWGIVENCWNLNPNDRPTMRNVIAMLPTRTAPVQPGAEKYYQLPHNDSKGNLITWASNTQQLCSP